MGYHTFLIFPSSRRDVIYRRFSCRYVSTNSLMQQSKDSFWNSSINSFGNSSINFSTDPSRYSTGYSSSIFSEIHDFFQDAYTNSSRNLPKKIQQKFFWKFPMEFQYYTLQKLKCFSRYYSRVSLKKTFLTSSEYSFRKSIFL